MIYLKNIFVCILTLLLTSCNEVYQNADSASSPQTTLRKHNLDYTKINCVFMIERKFELSADTINQLEGLSDREFFIVPVTDFNAIPKPIIFDLIPSYETCENTQTKIIKIIEASGNATPVLVERNLLDYANAFNGKSIFN